MRAVFVYFSIFTAWKQDLHKNILLDKVLPRPQNIKRLEKLAVLQKFID